MSQCYQFKTNGIALSLIAGLAGLLISGSVIGEEYPNTENFGSVVDKSADWYQRCMRVKNINPPKLDLPSTQLASSLAGCEPLDMYYDAKAANKADWQKVKACAFVHEDTTVLMMLYANGFGVKRNLELAMKYACSDGGAPAEVEGRVSHLASLIENGNPPEEGGKVFDVCDDITSGMMMGLCTAWSERQKERVRSSRLAAIVSSWDSSQRVVFEKLQTSESDFAEAVGRRETDQMGTARGELVLEAEAAERDMFVSDIEQYEDGVFPSFSEGEFKELDKQINQTYKKLMRSKTTGEYERLGFTTVTKSDVRETQRLWLKYRDAWVALGRSRYPSVSAYSWKALLTQRRIKQLEALQEAADD